MQEHFLSIACIGGWTIFSSYYLFRSYHNPSKVNPYLLESIPSVFPTLGIMCTAWGIFSGLSDFDASNIQNSLPQLLSGLKSAFVATIAGIAGLIIAQKALAYVQNHIDHSPNRPRQASDELSALNDLNLRFEDLEKALRNDLSVINKTLRDTQEYNVQQYKEIQNLIGRQITESEKQFVQTDGIQRSIDQQIAIGNSQLSQTENFQKTNATYLDRILNSSIQTLKATEDQTKKLEQGFGQIVRGMTTSNQLLTTKFDEFSELMRQNNTEALVEVMKATTEQFNAQMSELIDRLVKENFKELNSSVLMLNSWQKENKEQVAQLGKEAQLILTNVGKATKDLDKATTVLSQVAALTEELVANDGKLTQLVRELDKAMISDGKFTDIVTKVERSVDTLLTTTMAYDETTQKLNIWVRNQMNFSDKAEILISQLEEFRNLNGSTWDNYRAEMDKSINIIKRASTSLGKDLENINQEFYERLNDTLQNLDGLIQRFMMGQTTVARR